MDVLRIFLALITLIATITGGLVALKLKGKGMHYLLAFSAGTLLGTAFLDLLPEAAEIALRNSISLHLLFLVVLAGFFAYHVLEKFIHIHAHAHAKPHEESAVGLLGGSALIFHSFLDGVAIGTAFQASAFLGMVIALAVIIHAFSDGINIVAVTLKANASSKKAVLFLILIAIAPVAGSLATLLVPIPPYALAYLLAWFVGEFLYLGATDLLPTAHMIKSSAKTIAATFAGIALIFALSYLIAF